MQKQVHKIFLTLVMLCFLLSPSDVSAQFEVISLNDTIQKDEVEFVQNDVQIPDREIEPINTESIKKSVVPDPAKEGKKVLGLFLKTMAIVGICSLLLYGILLIVKKYYTPPFINADYEELDTLDLSTPSNKNDALKSFLNRTK